MSDHSVLRMIRKWIRVGVMEEDRLLMSETGTGQGQTISPMLANLYPHYRLDESFEESAYQVSSPRSDGHSVITPRRDHC
jgi:RNA-directed DNA polymerase